MNFPKKILSPWGFVCFFKIKFLFYQFIKKNFFEAVRESFISFELRFPVEELNWFIAAVTDVVLFSKIRPHFSVCPFSF